MKSIKLFTLIFLTILLQGKYVHGQTVDGAHTDNIMQHVHAILQKQEVKKHELQTAARNTSFPAERLIAHSTYDYYPPDSIMGMLDTSKFYYSSNARGSMFNYNTLSYNDNWYWGMYDYWYGRTIITLGAVVTSVQPNYFAQIFCDSSRANYYHFGDTTGTPYVWSDTQRTYETYNGNNDVVSFHSFLGSTNHFATLYNWAGHNNTESIYINYAPYNDTSGTTVSIFNTSGQLIQDSISYSFGGIVRSALNAIYTYDGTGNLVNVTAYRDSSGIRIAYRRWDMTYNADNFIRKDSFSFMLFGTSTWVADMVDSFGYTAGVSYYTYRRTNSYNDSTYPLIVSSAVKSKHVNSIGLPDTLYFSYTGYSPTDPTLLYPRYKQAFTYDTYRNPVESYQFYYNLTDTATGAGYYSTSPDITSHFYYESYLSNAGIKEEAANGEITIYPNPSTGIFGVTATSKMNNARVIVFNNVGQIVFEQLFSGTAIQIELGAQPNGIYFAEIISEANEVLKVGKLVKME